MVIIPDVVFLILGLACLMTLLSIRKELRKITRTKRKTYSEWSLEDQLKLRVKYLHQCRRLENHLNSLKNKIPA
jgi:UV DNA damage repair endonuclease